MKNEFLTNANLGKIIDYIKSEYMRYHERQLNSQSNLRAMFIDKMLGSEQFQAKHRKLFQWMEENPHIKITIDGYYRDSFLKQLAAIDAVKANPDIKPFILDKDGAVAYLHFLMPNNRHDAIKAILEKYYSLYPAFIENFDYQ